MQRVILLCLSFLAAIIASIPLFAQEAFAPEQLYFQGEIIRKVSLGHNSIWVVKGQDSTGVGKLDMQGIEHDYTSRINTIVPLTGIVGKYGDSAMIATKGNYLLMYDKGKITRLDEKYGVQGNRINDIHGTINFTAIGTDKGHLQSYDNGSFQLVNIGAPYEVIRLNGKNTISAIANYQGGNSVNTSTKHLSLFSSQRSDIYHAIGYSQCKYDINMFRSIYAIASTPVQGTDDKFFIGSSTGLTHTGCNYSWGFSSSFLRDTTVFSLREYRKLMLIGTDKGFYYTTKDYPKKVNRVLIGDDYKVFDIKVDEEVGHVWLATNKGLLKLVDYSGTTKTISTTVEDLAWAKSIGGALEDNVSASATDTKGNVYLTGSFSGLASFGDSALVATNQADFYLAKYSSEGNLLWIRSTAINLTAEGPANESGIALALDTNGNSYAIVSQKRRHLAEEVLGPAIGGPGLIRVSGTTENSRYVVKFDAQGNQQWIRPFESLQTDTDVFFETDKAGNLYIAHRGYSTTDPSLQENWVVRKFSSNFDQLWSNTYPRELDQFKLKPNGDFYLTGYSFWDLKVGNIDFPYNGNRQLLLVYLDHNGKTVWGKSFGGVGYNTTRMITGLDYDRMGNVFLSGNFEYRLEIGGKISIPSSQKGIFITKINPVGDFEWATFGEVSGSVWNNHPWQLVVDSLGFAFIAGQIEKRLTVDGHDFTTSTNATEGLLLKIDPDGKFSWGKKIPGIYWYHYQNDYKPVLSKGLMNDIFLVGQLRESLNLNGQELLKKGETQIFLAKISDPASVYNATIVSGKIFHDRNKNGTIDSGEEPLANNLIKAEPGPFYSKSDENGNYIIYLKNGEYTINQVIPDYKGKIIQQIIPEAPYVLELTSNKADTSGFDFGNVVNVSPFLSVDVTSTRFRRCFTNNTKVEFCNEGFADARNVQLVLEYPDYVIPITSSIPWTSKTGNTYTFSIGVLAAQSCRTITLKDSVICGNESIRGLTQCIKATILPPNTALNRHPDWDGSDITLTAACKDNGFVRVGFRNSGTGHMADSASFSIYLDQQQVYSGKYKLKAGEDLSLNLLANGKPLHLEAQLTPHHPEKRAVSITIQGCNNGSTGIINGGYVNQFPQNDEAENLEMACLPIIDSYDPNDKRVSPAGITATNNIAEDAQLEYTIRFQNTGTDTAYTVVVVDPLSEHLDISTLKVGIASHPVKWEFSRDNQPSIIWRFSKINLPDSTTNERGSHGFVKFKISPKEGLPIGTIIPNKADIYFDYNSPIITNEVFNTLGLPEITAGAKVLVQNCNTRIDLQQEPDSAAVLCGNANSHQLSRLLPVNGRGIWKVTKGTAILQDPFSHETLATNLSYGENEFSWIVTYCDQQVSSKVTVIRQQPLEKPQVKYPAYICQGDTYPAITASGEGVEWYRDAALTQLVLKGNTYQPTGQVSEMLYVIQNNEHCSSPATLVSVVVHQLPLPPVATPVEACVEVAPPVLTAQGSHLRWYADAGKQQLLAEGESFSPADMGSRSYWATQSSDYCESEPTEVVFTAKHFDPAKANIANVVTPNGDAKNQLYYVKDFEGKECMGEFISIRIYNRWGKQVYESKAADFKWDASALPNGVYYYRMDYQLNKFQGAMQVLR